MTTRALSRRAALLGGAAVVTLAGCAGQPEAPATPPPPDPETVLLNRVIAEKERIIRLYATVPSLRPFRERHEAHLAELRGRLPVAAASPKPAGTPSATPSATPAKASLRGLRDAERKAAAARPQQIASVSAPLAQLLASIGACEAAHALALLRSTA